MDSTISSIKDILLIISALSGWGVLVYNIYSNRICLKGQVMEVYDVTSTISSSGKEKTPAVIFFVSVSNIGAKSIHIEHTELRYKFEGRKYKIKESYMGINELKLGGKYTLTRKDFLTNNEALQPKSVRLGVVMFAIDRNSFYRRSKKKLTLNIWTTGKRVFKIKMNSKTYIPGISAIRQYFGKDLPDFF